MTGNDEPRREYWPVDIWQKPESDPVTALEWLAEEADGYMDTPLSPKWAVVLRAAAKAMKEEKL